MLAGLLSLVVLAPQGQVVDGSLVSEGTTRTYKVVVPSNYDPKRAWPLVLMLHGFTGSAQSQLFVSRIREVAEKEGFLGLVPNGQGNPQRWNVGFTLFGQGLDDGKFIGALLDQVAKNYRVDPRRVYVCGHSNGGMMAHYLAATMPERFAAFGAVAGSPAVRDRNEYRFVPERRGPISGILIHGEKDTIVPYDHVKQGGGIAFYPAPASAQWWATYLKLGDRPSRTVTDANGIRTETWSRRSRREKIVLVSLPNAGHEWPRTAPYSATEALWEFFRTVRK